MTPTIGRIVVYNTTESDRNRMRAAQNGCNIQDKLPAIIVAVWGETCVNLRVICDGNLDLWQTSACLGESEGNWNWPNILRL